MHLGFVVTTCIRTLAHAKALVRCLQSVRRFHGDDAPIVVVDDTAVRSADAEVRDATYHALQLATTWLRNPYPASGEFGACRVAAAFPCTCSYGCPPPELIVYMHDSTTLCRALTASDVAPVMKRGWMPLWYADRQYMDLTPCDDLAATIMDRVDEPLRERWRLAADDGRRMYVGGDLVDRPRDSGQLHHHAYQPVRVRATAGVRGLCRGR